MSEIEIQGGEPGLPASEIRERIAAYLRGTAVERAVLFGSYARGEADRYSDVDVVLVEATDVPFVERGLAHLELFRLGVGIDLLVYTPEEYARLRREGNPLIERIEAEGIEIHARSAS